MQYDFDNLLTCRKIVTKKPKKDFYANEVDKVNLRNEFECKSEDGLHEFLVKMRRNTLTPNDFSILLFLKTKDSNVEIQLCRYNCKQEHKDRDSGLKFTDFHIHKNVEMRANNKNLPADITKAYCNYDTAYAALLRDCNISMGNAIENQIDIENWQKESEKK